VGSVWPLNAAIRPPGKAGILRCNLATARRSPARSGAVACSTYQPVIAIVLWPGSSPVALLSCIHTEMFFQIRAESFGPLVERVFRCAGDDGCGTRTTHHAEQRSRRSHVLGPSRACRWASVKCVYRFHSCIYETRLPQLHYLEFFESVKLSMNINKKLLPI